MTHSETAVDQGAEIRIAVEIQTRDLPWLALDVPEKKVLVTELRSDADELVFGSILGETLTGNSDLGELDNTIHN